MAGVGAPIPHYGGPPYPPECVTFRLVVVDEFPDELLACFALGKVTVNLFEEFLAHLTEGLIGDSWNPETDKH